MPNKGDENTVLHTIKTINNLGCNLHKNGDYSLNL